MPSEATKESSSFANLLKQWQKQQDNVSYRILLQYSMDLATRLQAAGSSFQERSLSQQSEEEIVYRRAGLRAPAESALRDLMGGDAWIVHILEVALHQNLEVIFVRTLARKSYVPANLRSRIHEVDKSQDPWGWDCDDHDMSTSMSNLNEFYNVIRTKIDTLEGRPTILVFESLAPLVLVHGFQRTLRFLQAIDKPRSSIDRNGSSKSRLVQVWSTRIELFTSSQHAQMEQVVNALLYLKRGEMALMRQGIRESSNIVREILPFQLVPQEKVKEDNQLPFCLEEIEEKRDDDGAKAPVTVEDSPPRPSNSTGPSAMESGGQQAKLGRTKIKLQMESDDLSATKAAKPESEVSRPRIFMQADDPEFDDMDEEDPDDDLDI